MNRTVFILGAGASAEADGPLMSTFVSSADAIHRQRAAGNAQQPSFDLVFKAREKLQRVFIKSKLDLDNVEELFAAFEMAGLLGRLADLPPNEVSQLALSMRRVITTTLERNIKFQFDKDKALAPAPVYAAFAQLLVYLIKELRWPVSVITFNYDLALDYALTYVGMSIDYGLQPTHIPNALELFKLHGSLNWFRAQDEVVVASLACQGSRPDWDRFKERVTCSVSELVAPGQSLPEDLTDPVIVPPTWNKGQHHAEFKALWAKAAEHLAEAENIVVIGYSAPLTDQFYRHLFALSTISDTLLSRYLCVGPGVGSNHQKLMGGAGEARKVFKHLNSGFSQCFGWLLNELNIEPKVPSLFGASQPLAQHLTELAQWKR